MNKINNAIEDSGCLTRSLFFSLLIGFLYGMQDSFYYAVSFGCLFSVIVLMLFIVAYIAFGDNDE